MNLFQKTASALMIALALAGTGSFASAQATTAEQCKVLSAIFDPYSPEPSSSLASFEPPTYANKFFADSNPPSVSIKIGTENCAYKDVYVTLYSDRMPNAFNPISVVAGSFNPDKVVPELKNKKFRVPQNETLSILMKAGETSCFQSSNFTDGVLGMSGEDCRYYIYAGPNSGTDSEGTFFSKGKTYGTLRYECDTTCDEGWQFVSSTSLPEDATSLTAEDAGSLVDPNSACFDQATQSVKPDCYELYSGLSETLNSRLDVADTKFKTLNQDSLGGLLNAIIAFAIGIGGVLAVGMIMYQGFLYMKTDNANTKTTTRSSIVKTTLGFLLLLTIYVILRTINPDLLNLLPNIDNVTFNTGGDVANLDPTVGSGQVSSFKEFASSHGITCPGAGGSAAIPGIANSMKGKITYSMPQRGQTCANNTFCWDCSGFVGAVYSCAGLGSPGYTTSSIFVGAQNIAEMTSTSVNGQPLQPGDLLGWTAGSLTNGKPESYGHVVMYIGNGMVIESTSGNGGKKPGKAVQVKSADAYKKRLKFIKRIGGGSATGGTQYGGSEWVVE